MKGRIMKMISVDGGQLAVLDQGAGPPLLLVHGFPLDQSMWRNQWQSFATDHRVIVPDLRGFGSSSAVTGTVTMAQHADDLLALLDGLDVREPVHLCAMSMGGYVAFEFLRRHPSRLKSLILCDTKAAADAPEAAANREKMAADVLREGAVVAEKAMLSKLLAADAPQRQPDVVEHVRQMILGTRPETIASAQRGMAARADMTGLLTQIQLPTLLIVGELDVIATPQEMQGMADRIAKSRLATIARAGHLTPLEAPAEFNAAVREFLVENA
ncbi:MAG: alpha/beta hydrolase [Planctomycetes bacterium]|nr:alpha/beta hydrolase [Planctomycetota bacterium]